MKRLASAALALMLAACADAQTGTIEVVEGDTVCQGGVLIDGRDVADIMVELGLARRYDGRGPRRSWCP